MGFWGQVKRGTAVSSAKLNDEKVREMRKLYAAGVSVTELAGRYGVSPGTIVNAVERRTWRHVTDE